MTITATPEQIPAIVQEASKDHDITPITAMHKHRGATTHDLELSLTKTQDPMIVEQHIDLDDDAAIKSANEFAQQILQAAANQDENAVQNLTDMMLRKFNINDKIGKGKETVININFEPKAKQAVKQAKKVTKKKRGK